MNSTRALTPAQFNLLRDLAKGGVRIVSRGVELHDRSVASIRSVRELIRRGLANYYGAYNLVISTSGLAELLALREPPKNFASA